MRLSSSISICLRSGQNRIYYMPFWNRCCMDRIACMQSFVRAIELNSFSAAAREQQTTQPTISKQIAALEKYLGVQLLTRSTTHLSLTEEGRTYYKLRFTGAILRLCWRIISRLRCKFRRFIVAVVFIRQK
jgi:hypothetical protein